MENVIVNREVVAAFEKMATALEHRKSAIMNAYLINVGTWTEDYAILNDVDFDTLVALIYGVYEIQKTPHETLRDKYEKELQTYRASSFAAGILFTLDTLGEKVEGVNEISAGDNE